MSSTNVDNVRNIASHLDELEDSQIELYMEDAELEIPDDIMDSEYGEKAHRYLTAHLATLDVRRPTREDKLNLSVSYSDDDTKENVLSTTKYGKEYSRIAKKASGNNTPIYKLFS
ncbi:MAG: DUF4054 domain-containing protein [Halanaerobacter sp.]